MKIISKSLLWSSAFSLVLPQAAFASLSSAYASLVDTSQNQAFESEPAQFLKLAAVHFITKNGQLSFGGGNPGGQEFNPGDLCKSRGYLHKGCPAGYIPGEACTEDSSFVKECIDPDTWCRGNGYNVTSCTLPKYLSGKCPHSSTLYKSCETDNARACREAGYSAECETGKIKDKACPYDSSYGTCICNPCAGFTYTAAEANAQGYVPGEVCNSCGTMKYKRSEAPCDGFKTCDCGGATGAKTCWSGTVKKFDTCKECCDTSKYKYDSSNCTGVNQLAGNSCGGKYDRCLKMGKILYGDGTTSYNIISGKTAIGVVFDEAERLAIALKPVHKLLPNSSCARDDVICSEQWTGVMFYEDVSPDFYSDSAAENCEFVAVNNASDYAACGANGRINTTLLLNTEKSPHIPVDLVNNYEPAGCVSYFCKKTNWFLPSIKELSSIFDVREELDNTLTLLGQKALDRWHYWSSTERSKEFMLGFSFKDTYSSLNGCITTDNRKECYIRHRDMAKYNNGAHVLPVVKY